MARGNRPIPQDGYPPEPARAAIDALPSADPESAGRLVCECIAIGDRAGARERMRAFCERRGDADGVQVIDALTDDDFMILEQLERFIEPCADDALSPGALLREACRGDLADFRMSLPDLLGAPMITSYLLAEELNGGAGPPESHDEAVFAISQALREPGAARQIEASLDVVGSIAAAIRGTAAWGEPQLFRIPDDGLGVALPVHVREGGNPGPIVLWAEVSDIAPEDMTSWAKVARAALATASLSDAEIGGSGDGVPEVALHPGAPERSEVLPDPRCTHRRGRWRRDGDVLNLTCDGCRRVGLARVPLHEVEPNHPAMVNALSDPYFTDQYLARALARAIIGGGVAPANWAALTAASSRPSLDPATYAIGPPPPPPPRRPSGGISV